MGTNNGLSTTIATQLVEIVECRLGSRQNDDIGLRDIIHIIGIEQMDARIALEGIEIGIVRKVFQHDDSHIDLALLQLPRLLSQRHTILLLDVDILEVRNDTQHRYATELFEHLAALVEEAHIATEFIDDDAFDATTVFRTLQGDAAIDGGKHAPTIDIAHEDDIGISMSRHRHIDQIGITEIDFGDATSTLHHDGVVLS